MRAPPLRLLIVLSWVFLLGGFAAEDWLPLALTPAGEAAHAQLEAESLAWMDALTQWQLVAFIAGAVALLALDVIGSIGMFFYRRWGRTLSVATTLVLYLSVPFSGVALVGPVDGLLLDLATLTWGGALALAYWSSAAERFAATGDTAPRVDVTVLAPP